MKKSLLSFALAAVVSILSFTTTLTASAQDIPEVVSGGKNFTVDATPELAYAESIKFLASQKLLVAHSEKDAGLIISTREIRGGALSMVQASSHVQINIVKLDEKQVQISLAVVNMDRPKA